MGMCRNRCSRAGLDECYDTRCAETLRNELMTRSRRCYGNIQVWRGRGDKERTEVVVEVQVDPTPVNSVLHGGDLVMPLSFI